MESRAVVLRDCAAGAEVLRIGLEGRGRFALIHRADLIGILHDGAQEAGVEIVTGCRVEDAAARLKEIRAEDRKALLVGADGGRSIVRDAIMGQADPAFTGQVAWRSVVPSDPGEVAAEAQVFMGPGRHLVAYPLRDGKLLNLVAVEEKAAWTAEGWRQTGDPEVLRRAFAGFGGPVPDWLARVETVHRWGLFKHPVARRWSADGMVLIGDAAHPTLPFLAQGACMALEDCWVLAAILERHWAGRGALRLFQMQREKRVRRIVDAATANARNYHLANPLVRMVAHTGLRMMGRLMPRAAGNQFDWLYGHDVTAVR